MDSLIKAKFMKKALRNQLKNFKFEWELIDDQYDSLMVPIDERKDFYQVVKYLSLNGTRSKNRRIQFDDQIFVKSDSNNLADGNLSQEESELGKINQQEIIEQQEIVTIRLKSNLDLEFIEIDVDTNNTSFEEFIRICLQELNLVNDIVPKKLVKQGNILIRNTRDIRRLKNNNEIEIFIE
jgi:hypothetical protein